MGTKGRLTGKSIMNLVRGFQPACVIIAGAELDVFTTLHARPMSALQMARRIGGNVDATLILLDASRRHGTAGQEVRQQTGLSRFA